MKLRLWFLRTDPYSLLWRKELAFFVSADFRLTKQIEMFQCIERIERSKWIERVEWIGRIERIEYIERIEWFE